MHARDLRDGVWIEAATVVRDAQGGEHKTWAPDASLPNPQWANFRSVGGKEKIEGGAVTTSATKAVTLRFCEVTPAHRIKVRNGGRVLSILTVRDPDDSKTWIECECIEAV
jgi:SPP1 family predicted phage head-tail adaptor